MTEGAACRQQGEAILGHVFAQPALLVEALTHRSANGNKVGQRGGRRGEGSNERLEFIGDRVLGLVIAEWLIERFPAEQEGELARRMAQLTSHTVLAEVAEVVGLAGAIVVGPKEERAGVRQTANVLADALEATIAALYMDAGLEVARTFVRRAWTEAMERQVVPPKDAKTALQEWMMARALPLPAYVEQERTGPSHAPVFVVTVTSGGLSGMGTGSSKRMAERAAAADLLGRLAPPGDQA